MGIVVVSSPIGFAGATVKFEDVAMPTSMEGVTSYVGHPATRALLEALGATTVSGKWAGPSVGESYLAVPLALNPREGGFTRDVAISDVSELRAILCTRIA